MQDHIEYTTVFMEDKATYRQAALLEKILSDSEISSSDRQTLPKKQQTYSLNHKITDLACH